MTETIKTVSIPNIAWETAADIHFPPNFDENKKYPAVVSAHPTGSCKEQTSGNVYGKAMAEAGFVVVAFDASFQGASGGKPRFIENPEFRVSDFRFVVDYVQTLPYVDADRIGVLGICGGGAYAINAAMTDYRFKCCVGITPANFGRLSREGFASFDPAGALEKMAAQRTAEAQGGERLAINYLPATVEDASKATSDIDIIEATDYYKTNRGEAPNGCTSGLFSFNSAALTWDAFNHTEKLMTRPLMVVVGEKPGGFGAYRDAHEVHSRAASKEKHIVVLPEVSHYMLYDKPEAVKPALEQVLPFFKKHLGDAKSPPVTEQQLPVATVQPASGPAHPYEDEKENVDLGYSLVSGSNAFVDLQAVLGNEEFQEVSAAYDGVSQIASPKRDIESLIAKLPPRSILEVLVDLFFDEVNSHYFILEKYYFNELFSRWPPKEDLQPVKYLSSVQLSTELRYFPALLFQVIALSLQFLPPDWDKLSSSSHELLTSRTYSDLGDNLLYLLGRPGFTITAIQADFLRSSWLKNCGRAVEAWHTIGYAIRLAQELGLHKQKEIYQSSKSDLEETLNLLWYDQNKKRLWINLFVWDGYVAMILGRPRMIHMDDCDAKPPMDCSIPEDPSTAVPMTVRLDDNPDISTASAPLFRYALACKVHEMRALKADRPRPKDYSVVQTLHKEIISLAETLPAYLRQKNPDTTWDQDHSYLPQLREELQVMANLFLMTLHRPHIISNLESRKAALQASLETLDCQLISFAQAKQHQYHLFGLAFYTIEAALLTSIIAILFPPQNYETKHKISNSLEQVVESLSEIKPFNPIAASGLDIVRRCLQRIKTTTESPSSVTDARTAPYETPVNIFNSLMSDLNQEDLIQSQNSQSGSSQPNLTSEQASSINSIPTFPNNFDQTYWLDQLSVIDPFISEQDSGNLWDSFLFDT